MRFYGETTMYDEAVKKYEKPPKWKYQCTWSPKPDITTYELAKCLPFIFSKLHEVDDWDLLDESITRHFSVVKIDYEAICKETAAKLEELTKDW